MERKWTAAQSAAMNTRNKTLLVSAAAGSGKTATLTERIIRSVTDPQAPSDISKMLIVTFTRAAAEELKTRIFQALSEALAKNPSDRHLTSQLIKLGSAKICTIDAFYLDLIRSHFSTLGLSPSFRIADPAELEILARSVMEETVEFFYDTDDEFPSFVECFASTRSSDQLIDVLFDLDIQAASVPEGIEFLRICAKKTKQDADKDFFATDFGIILRKRSMDLIQHAYSVFEAACNYACSVPEIADAMLPSLTYDRDFCERLLDALQDEQNGYARAKELLESFAPVRLKRLKAEYVTEESERFKALRTALHTQIRDLGKKSFSKSAQSICRAMEDTARYTEKLFFVLQEYERRMSEEKKKRNLMDFNDVRRNTLQLLVNEDGSPTTVALQYAEQFSDIYIDEYQDVDRVQDMIFRSISRTDNRFMVGDIKQSIYSFRGAEPQVFAEYRALFPNHESEDAKDSDTATIFMSENFRCDQNVIDFTNLICSRIFSACADIIGYQKADDLVFSKVPPSEDYQSPSVNVTVVLSENGLQEDMEETPEALDKKDLEAEYIALEIQRLIHEERKADGSPILPGDIAVLFRSRSMSAHLAKALQKRGILTSENDGDRYFENPDVLMVLCLLNTVDNPHRDIFLTGTLRSPLFRFSMDDLIRIRAASDATDSLYDALLAYKERKDSLAEHCRAFEEILTNLRQEAAALPVDGFLRMVLESDLFVATGLMSSQNESGDGGNLLRLYEYARTFESGSFKGLYNFIEFINTIIEKGQKMKVPPKGISPDRVNLMTIHQSKGLEFPVCFVCGTGNRFNRRDQYESLLFEYPAGVAMKISDSTGFARINTPMREALVANTEIRQIEEEMRVLYVALTRARERLYVTASSSSTEDALKQTARARASFCGRHTLLRCNSYLDWVLIPLTDPFVDTSCCTLSFLTASELAKMKTMDALIPQKDITSYEIDTELRDHLIKEYAFEYPYLHFRRIPAKLSVSRLSPDALDENDNSVDIFTTSKATAIPDFFLPQKAKQASAAERGTATHLFLQFCNFEYAKRHGVKEEIARLIDKGFIPSQSDQLIYAEELETFLQSELVLRIQNAKQIVREQRFNVFLSPENFSLDETFRRQVQNEKLAVQGVIDLVLIDPNGRLMIYDYKTDRLSREELQNPSLAKKKMNQIHGQQLSYYAHAAELLFDRPCEGLFVYSTHAGHLIEIEPQALTFSENLIDSL